MDQQEAVKLLKKILKENQYSFTAARNTIFNLLWNQKPQSMLELEKSAARKLDRTSIYRNITLFEKLGLVQRITIGWKYKLELSDVFTHHHHHISCLECGRIQSIQEDQEIERLIHSITSKYNMTAERHQLEIQGTCASCTLKNN